MNKKTRIKAFSISVLLICSCITAYAYLSASTGPLTNLFSAFHNPEILVNDTMNAANTEKTNACVDVGNPGYAVYVRAAVVIAWENEDGSIHAETPNEGAEKDYVLDINTEDWIKGSDGFYYYKEMISSGLTEPLINSLKELQLPPTGYTLHVEIIAQTIQALGTTDTDNVPAVVDAWKVQLTDGIITDTP